MEEDKDVVAALDPVEDLFVKLEEYVPLLVCGIYKLPLVDEVDLLGEITGILCL